MKKFRFGSLMKNIGDILQSIFLLLVIFGLFAGLAFFSIYAFKKYLV